MEQVHIVGKRSGEGFVAHKDTLVNALSRVLAERVTLFNEDITLGRKGFLVYLKALAGSNIVKIVPANGNASGSQVTGKGVKVVCGSHESYLPNGAWLKDKVLYTFSQIRVSPSNAVTPNLGSIELAEALSRVLPFTSSDDKRPVLQCVKLEAKEGKLTLASADGFRLAIVSLDFEDTEAEALIHRDDVKGLITALRKAKRVKLAIEQKADTEGGLLSKTAIINTELVKYSLPSKEGDFPDYGNVVPTEFNASASFDAKEAIKACRSLLTVWYDDSLKPLYRPLILTIGEGRIGIDTKEERGKAHVAAETEGEAKIAVSGNYLLDVLKACNGIVTLQVTNAQSPMLFSVDGFRLVLMPLNIPITDAKPTEAEAVTEAESVDVAKALKLAKANLRQAKAKGNPEAIAKAKQAVKVAKANLRQAKAQAAAEVEAVAEAVTEEAEAVTEEGEAEVEAVAEAEAVAVS